MKRNMKRNVAMMLATGLTLFFSGQALAIGTPDDKTIRNTASVTFEIDGHSPPAVQSEEVTFKVDTKIRPVVAQASDVYVVAGVDDFLMPFLVTNESNSAAGYDYFDLTHEEMGTSTFSMNSVEIWEDSTGDGNPDKKVSGAVQIPNTDGSNFKTFWIIADTPNPGSTPDTGASNQRATYSLIAIAVADENSAALTAPRKPNDNNNTHDNSEIVLFDDGGSATDDIIYDGKHSNSGTYITRATLDISKLAGNGTSNFHIPGDVVEYTITVTNNDPNLAAKNVVVIDEIPLNTTYHSFSDTNCLGTQAWFDKNLSVNNWVPSEPATKADVGFIRCTFSSDILKNSSGTVKFSVTIN
ncbi:hypothetical protein [Desulfosediminicola sp.]|uniref:hypothetical protein n=1 Tax=Desulfosediminicola sp. TaxID=2886825 RepID=UPI003AF2D5B7